MMQQKRHVWVRTGLSMAALLSPVILVAVVAGCGGSSDDSGGLPGTTVTRAQVLQGRALVTNSGCTDCHNRGKNDPSDPNWMAGYMSGNPQGAFAIGPFNTYAANLTPDKTTGIGNFTPRQIFNALRYGLDPAVTPDVVITGTTPGQGNYPASPEYLAPPMPWTATRHLSDDDTWAIVAYLLHGIKPVANSVPNSQGPPDHWASSYTTAAAGPARFPDYPTGNEQFNP